jgi:hypothetical protein
MFDELELAQYKVDVVITPVVSQELPKFTLVAGGEKALRLASLLSAKFIVPMRNGGLKQTGVLSKIIRAEGSEEGFRVLVEASGQKMKVLSAFPGQKIKVLT